MTGPKKLILAVVSLAVFCMPALAAQPGQNNTTQNLINELNRLIQQGERDRLASPGFLDQLRGVSRQYNWPWKKTVLFDDFRDGNFTQNPRWINQGGDFWIVREGLRTQFKGVQSTPAQGNQGTKDALLGLLLDQVIKDGAQGTTATQADIFTDARTGNAVAVTLELSSSTQKQTRGHLEWGLTGTGQAPGSAGYRLVYYTGTKPALELQRIARGRTSIIEAYERGNLLEDGQKHQIIWQRYADGRMVVQLDKRIIMQAVDRGINQGAGRFYITNRGGD
ncbi:MAG: hypothetical protein ACE5DY_07930, partial [Mariprofundaceae bacterium]